MSKFRNIDMSPDPSIKQGSRIVHPIYARYAVKDGKGSPEDVLKSVSESTRNITPTNFPVNVRLCNRLRSFDKVHGVPSIASKGVNYRRKVEKETLGDRSGEITEAGDSGRNVDSKCASDPASTSEVHMAIMKDNVAEKNKKSSIEQKRFYQRKLSGFSPIKFLPVGKLFKFFRPPLQRRNSCPVLSIHELEAEVRVSQPTTKCNPSAIVPPNKIASESNASRLTKWTSHQELQLPGKDSSPQNNPNIEFESNIQIQKHPSFRVPDRTSVTGSTNSVQNCQLLNGDNVLKNNQDYKPRTESSVIETTVIILSENTASIPDETNNYLEINEYTQSEKININNGVSIPMSSSTLQDWEPDNTDIYVSKIKPDNIESTNIQKQQVNSITIVSSDSVQGSSSPNSNHIQFQNTIAQQGNTFSTKSNAKQLFQVCEKGNFNSLNSKNKDCDNDLNNKILLEFQNIEKALDNAIVQNNPLSEVGNKSDNTDSRQIYVNDTTEFIRITPSKANNILYTNDSINRSFSTFKSEPKCNTTVSIQNNGIKLDESNKTDRHSRDSSSSNPFVNFTLLPSNSQQNSIKSQNKGNRKIYLPAEVVNNRTSDVLNDNGVSDDSEDNEFITISSEYQRIFEKITTERKADNSIKNCDNLTSSSVDKTNSYEKSQYLENKDPQPQLIRITCTPTPKNNNTESSNKNNFVKNAGIIVNVVNGTSDNDSLDFGENRHNALINELQSQDINECYNVKLDAPEEVIVAGFHDFCHTMLSLEESLESHDTGTVKRKKVKTKPEISDENENYSTDETVKIFNNNQETYSSQPIKKPGTTNENLNGSLTATISNDHSSDKLLEEIQNSKLLEKMNIKDPDVIDAITALDNSLREASEQPILSQKEISEIESGLLITKAEMSLMEAKRRTNIVKEDKIQCDNLIEEVLLEDATSKRVLNSHKRAAPPPPPKRDCCIAVTISQSHAQQLPSTHSHNSQIGTSVVKQQNISPNRRLSNIENSSFNDTSSETGELSDYCQTAGSTKKINIMLDAKDNSSSLPGSISSEEINPTLPLQVSVDNNSTGLQDVVACNRTSPCSVDSGTSSHNQGYFVVVAIDFGTTYSGYAFSFTRDPDNIHMMKKWDGGDPGVSNQKTPTTLLLSPEGSFHSFGFSARDYYHDLDVDEAKGWLYFEKFKMALHYNEHLSLDTEIAAANGKRMPAVIIFAHALRYFKDHALQELSDQSATRILNEDVRWVVTVPAIWKQPAKQFMRAAAYKAGIASPDFPDQLLIALEPEAASIYCRRMRLHQLVPEETQYQRSFQRHKDRDAEMETDSTMSEKDLSFSTNIGQGSDGSFNVGTRYMVVDCGGGTVDITVHELLDKQGALKELQKASGGPYGSMGVDMEFETFLADIFGRDFMQQFKTARPTGYVDLMIAFEARKRNASPYKNNSLNISLPFSFIDYYKKCKGSSVETAIKKSSHKNIKWSQGMLRLEPSAMDSLFQKTIEQIRKHIEDIISAKDLCIDYIFLVGGFAESLILQKEIKEAFSSKLKVVIPQGVSLAILKGAVLFGLDPTTVNIRRLRLTYGVGVLNQFIHGVHPREKLVIKNGKQWCADVFDKFVVNEQSVGVGDVVVRRYTPAKDGQSCSVIHIYCSENDNVYFITDPGVKRCATLILDLSDSRYIQSREIQTRMMFGDTEIKVSALDVTTGKCVKAEIDFLNN